MDLIISNPPQFTRASTYCGVTWIPHSMRIRYRSKRITAARSAMHTSTARGVFLVYSSMHAHGWTWNLQRREMLHIYMLVFFFQLTTPCVGVCYHFRGPTCLVGYLVDVIWSWCGGRHGQPDRCAQISLKTHHQSDFGRSFKRTWNWFALCVWIIPPIHARLKKRERKSPVPNFKILAKLLSGPLILF